MFKKGDIVELKVDGSPHFNLGLIGTGVGIVVAINMRHAIEADEVTYQVERSELYPDKWFLRVFDSIGKYPRNIRLYDGN